MNKCECEQSGWCERHQCEKTPHLHKLCRMREDYFRLWERGRGPGQTHEVPLEIAPVRSMGANEKPWEGNCKRKPWQYKVTAVIPVLDTFETLKVVIDLLRLQTEKPFIVVVDTGSTPEQFEKIETLRAEDVEVHALRLNGVRHPSDFPAMAMDLAFTICRTPLMFATHADCFLRNRHLIQEMAELCETKSPVVGYELSPREHKDWVGMVGHTCTMMDMGVMDDLNAGWSIRRLARQFGMQNYEPDPMRPNWPDTELLLNYTLRKNGITAHIIGHEENHVRNKDENIDHCRSLTAGLLYNDTYYKKAMGWAEDAISEAEERIQLWKVEARTQSNGQSSPVLARPVPVGTSNHQSPQTEEST